MVKILVSACLLGNKVRYNGSDVPCESDLLSKWQAEGRLVPFCPEIAAGFGVPRAPAEIAGGDGDAVLDGSAQVFDRRGRNVSNQYVYGAAQALILARTHGVSLAILKDGSPSCGSTYTYDGTFSGVRRSGHGVTAALLGRSGIRVFDETEIEAVANYIAVLEISKPQEP